MTLISIEVAKSHLRVVGNDEDADIELKLEAAEQSAVSYLNRNVYPDKVALEAAIEAAPAAFAEARQEQLAAMAAAALLTDCDERAMAKLAAAERWSTVRLAGIHTHRGIVINSAIKAAILLIVGHLYENREDVVVGLSVAQLPLSATSLLRPHRIGVPL